LCNGVYNVSDSMQNAVAIWTDAALIAADVVVLAVTWWRTYKIHSEAKRNGVQAPLATLLLRDGTIYFLLFLILNVVEIPLWLKDLYINISTYIPAMTSIIMSRFLLSLRQINDDDINRPIDASRAHSTIRFSNSMVGNMGADLDTTFAGGSLQGCVDEDESAIATEEPHDPHNHTINVEILEISRV